MSASAEQRVLPARFEDADLDDLVILIADMLQRLTAHNDKIPLSPDALTRFHSRSPPSITVLEYLRRIVTFTNVERTCLLITLHYIDQICASLPRFTISSLTVHRFIIASIAVSSKAFCDVFCTNTHYAKVGGVRVAELNLLEREFLAAIDWRLACTSELLQEYYVNLARTHSSSRYRVAEPQSSGASSGGEDISRSPSPGGSGAILGEDAPPPAAGGTPMDEDGPQQPAVVLVKQPSSRPNTPTAAADGTTVPLAVRTPPPPPPPPPACATLEQNMAFVALQQKIACPGTKRPHDVDVAGAGAATAQADVGLDDALRAVRRKVV